MKTTSSSTVVCEKVLRVNIVNPGMLGVRCSPTCLGLTALPCPCFAGYLKFKTLDHLKQSSSSNHSTPQNGSSVQPSTFLIMAASDPPNFWVSKNGWWFYRILRKWRHRDLQHLSPCLWHVVALPVFEANMQSSKTCKTHKAVFKRTKISRPIHKYWHTTYSNK
jgi:hypothetical protein